MPDEIINRVYLIVERQKCPLELTFIRVNGTHSVYIDNNGLVVDKKPEANILTNEMANGAPIEAVQDEVLV